MTGPITVGPNTRGSGTVAAEAADHVSVDDLRGRFLHHGRYRLLDLLGVGGPSEVWLAQDTHLDRQVAIKTLRADAGGTWAELTAHEARTLAQIDHPHVVPIYDSFAEWDKPWIVMKFIRGRTLADILEADGPLPEDKLWDVARALSSALAASHRVGIVHRDLKPANVMIGPDNTIWLVDFGIALNDVTLSGRTQHRTTTPGRAGEPAGPQPRAVGTLAFMAPEALSGKPDRPADLWSLGVLLVTLATGTNPFQRPDPIATAGAILHAPVPDLPVPSLQRVVRQLLQRNPSRRPTAEDLAARLRAGVPDRVAPEAGGFFRRPWHRPTSGAPGPAGADSPPVRAMSSTRADSELASTGLAYWGMSRILDQPVSMAPIPGAPGRAANPGTPIQQAPPPPARVQPAPVSPVRADHAVGPASAGSAPERVRDRRPRRSPTEAVRHASAITLPVLGGWAVQSVAAFAGFWVGLLCLAPGRPSIPPWSVLVACVVASVAASCLCASTPRASSGRWLTITAGWAVALSVGMTTALRAGPWAAGAVPVVALGAAWLLARVYAEPAGLAGPQNRAVEPRTAAPSALRSIVTVLVAAVAVAVGPAAANGVLVLSGHAAVRMPMLLISLLIGVLGVAVVLARGDRAAGTDAGLRDLSVTCAGVVAGFTTTSVLATGLTVWTGAFGRTTRWSDDTRWWAYGLAAAVLMVALAGQIRLGRAVGNAAARRTRPAPIPGTTARPDRSLGHLGALVAGSLAVAVVGATLGAVVMTWAGQLAIPALLFVVPAVAGSYVAALAACARLTSDPPRRVGHRNPARYVWTAAWTAGLTVLLALTPLALTAVLPQLDRAALAVGAALCTVVGGVAGQLPVERAFRWTRRQTGSSLGRHGLRFAAQLLAAAAGIAVGVAVLGFMDGVRPTPPGIAVAVVVAALGIVVVDLARAGTVASCVFLLAGAAAAVVGASWVQAELTTRLGEDGWTAALVAALIASLIGVGVAAVYLVRFAAELTRNTRGERSNHAFTALLFAAAAAGAVYGVLALAG